MKKKLIIIIIIAIVILMILGLFGYKNSKGNDDNTGHDDKLTTVDIKDNTVQYLYSYLSDNKMYIVTDEKYKTVYQDKLITYKELTPYSILRNVFYRLEKDHANIGTYNTRIFSNNIPQVFNTLDDRLILFLDKCEVGNNPECDIPVKIDSNEITGRYNVNCDDDLCMWILNGNDSLYDEPLYTLIKAEKSGDEYYLYDSVFYSDGKNLYSNYSKERVVYTSPNDNLINYEFVEDNYDEYLYTYKHTYKKNKSDKYYWYSTEPIK